jgi:type VI secretion system secreted protein Hcp
MKKAGLALLAVAALGATVAAIAWSAAADDSATIHACVANGSDLVRIPGGDGCRPSETAITWNAQGPAGPPGPQGPAGPAGGGASEPNGRVVGFMHVDGASGAIEGDATEKGHEKWITLLGYDGDASVPISTTGGGGAGKVQLKPIVITKRIDKSTPKLFQALVTGRHLPNVQIDFVRPGAGGDETFYSVKLDTVFVTDLHQVDQGKSDGQALEQVSLDFQKIEITESDGTASGGGPVS